VTASSLSEELVASSLIEEVIAQQASFKWRQHAFAKKNHLWMPTARALRFSA
jgi:hypothetical protein